MAKWEENSLSDQDTSKRDNETYNQETVVDTDSQSEQISRKTSVFKAPSWKTGDKILEEFEVVRHLGKGGAGSVYLVKRISLGDVFAAKVPIRSIADDARLRKLFYREIRTWMGLPAHPHLSACRFIRSVDQKIVVFSEFVDGGTLREWIENKRLIKLEEILDVAIQIAWGLQAAHANKVIHQDMKPSNVLLDNQGLVKITDFGLSRAYQAVEDEKPDDKTNEQTPLSLDQASVSTGIMTPMYCSPEQSDHLPLDYRTDIWSWGLTVLSMFTGPMFWLSGVMAGSILESVIAEGPKDPYPPIPEAVIDILRICFKKKPADRWSSMKEIADRLITVYEETSATKYSRQEPEITIQISYKGGATPDESIRQAYIVLNKDQAELETLTEESVKNHKTWVLHQIELIHEIVLELKNKERAEKENHRNLIIDLLIHKTVLHREIADFEGSTEILDQLQNLLTELPFDQLTEDDRNHLARVNYQYGYTHLRKREFTRAAPFFLKAEKIWSRLVEKHDLDKYWENIINALISRAIALHSTLEIEEALTLRNRSDEIFDMLIVEKGRDDLRGKAASFSSSKALLLSKIGRIDEAIELHLKGISIREKLCFDEGQEELYESLPTGYINLACDLYALDRQEEAIHYNNKAIDILEELVYKKGMAEHRLFLARTYMNRGNAQGRNQQPDESLDSFDEGIKIMNQMLYQEGNTSMVDELLLFHRNKAFGLTRKKQFEEAEVLHLKSLELVTEYHKDDDINASIHLLSWVYNDLSLISDQAGDREKAIQYSRKAVDLFKAHADDATLSPYYFIYLRVTLWDYLDKHHKTMDFQEFSKEVQAITTILDQYNKSVTDDDINELKLGFKYFVTMAQISVNKTITLKTQLEQLLTELTQVMETKSGNAVSQFVEDAEKTLRDWSDE